MDKKEDQNGTAPGLGPVEVTILVIVIVIGIGSATWAIIGPGGKAVEEELIRSCEAACAREIDCDTELGQEGAEECLKLCVVQNEKYSGGCVDEAVAFNECLTRLSCQELGDDRGCEEEKAALEVCSTAGGR